MAAGYRTLAVVQKRLENGNVQLRVQGTSVESPAPAQVKVGDAIDAIVLGVDPDKKRLSLSVKHFELVSEKEHLDKFMQDKSPKTATLGDFIKLKLGE